MLKSKLKVNTLWFPLVLWCCNFVCLLSNTSSLLYPAVVHGQGEGRGDVAQQTDLAEAGEAHGKSCDLKDTRNPEGPSCCACG